MRSMPRQMNAVLVGFLTLSFCVWLASSQPTPTPAPPSFTAGMTWQNIAWCGEGDGSYTQCQNTALVLDNHTAIFVDLFDTTTETMNTLRAGGSNRRIVCYYSSGTWESWRVDKDNLTSVKRNKMSSWDGEWWLDITSESNRSVVQAAMEWRLQLAKDKGCDAVEPDNVDCFSNSACRLDRSTENALADQLTYNQWTANAAHTLGLAVGLKNDVEQVVTLQPLYDFSVNEDCRKWNECDKLMPFISANKAVFQTAYSGVSSSSFDQWCQNVSSIQGSPLFSVKVDWNGTWRDCEVTSSNSTSDGSTTTTTASPNTGSLESSTTTTSPTEGGSNSPVPTTTEIGSSTSSPSPSGSQATNAPATNAPGSPPTPIAGGEEGSSTEAPPAEIKCVMFCDSGASYAFRVSISLLTTLFLVLLYEAGG